MVPSFRSIPYKSTFPRLLKSQFIAPNCTIIGDVETGHNSSLFFGVTIRSENSKVIIGKDTVIQDNTQILNSCNDFKTISIGNKVTIGCNCYIDSSTIDDDVVIGNGATIHKNSHIMTGSYIAAGSVVLPSTTIPKNQIWAGNPAKYLRDIKPDEKDTIAETRDELLELGNVLVEETEKTQHEILMDLISWNVRVNISPDQEAEMEKNMVAYSATVGPDDDMGVESVNEGYDDLEMEDNQRAYDFPKDFTVNSKFEQDIRSYPDYFKIYNENNKRYDEINRREEELHPGEQRDIFEDKIIKPVRSGAMRAWINKWDSDFNVTFKNVGSKVEQTR